MKKLIYTLSAFAIVALAACGAKEGKQYELTLTGSEKITEKTDFFPGSDASLNSDQINQKLDSLLKANKSDRSELQSVKLEEVSIKIVDTANTFNLFKSIKLEVMAEESETIAKKENIQPNGAKELKLDTLGFDFKKFLEKGDIFFTASGNTAADTLKAPLKTVLTYKIKVRASTKE